MIVEIKEAKKTVIKDNKYPHRVVIMNRSVDQIFRRLKYLIDRKIETHNSIESTSIKHLSHKYFPNAVKEDVVVALTKLRAIK